MSNTSRFWLFRAFLVCLLPLMACQTPSSLPKGRIRLNLKNEPPTLDPRKGGDVISSHMHFLLFEGLVRLNADYSITMAQAESFERSSEGTVYTFKLRDTFWSNGMPVVAQDFETAWKAMLDPAFPCPNAHLLYTIKNAEAAKKGDVPLSAVGIEAKDSKTFVITLDKPVPYFLELISFCVFFPVCSQVDKAYPDWAYNAGEHFVSNGPFVLKAWKHNDELVATKNPLYWDGEKTRPEEIHFSMVGDEMTALHLFEKGQLDMIGDPISSLPLDALAELKKKWGVQKYPVGGTTLISFNVENPPFNNVKIRKALSFALHRTDLVQNITQTEELPALNMVPPILKGGRNRAFFADAEDLLAKELLKEGLEEEGIDKKDLNTLTYYYSISDKNHKIAQAIQQQWKEILGIEVKLESLEFKVLMDKLCKRDYSFAQTLWVAQYNDPMNILERFKYKTNVKNYPQWFHPEYVQLLERSFYEEGQVRAATLEEAEELFLSEMPVCPIYHWDMNYIAQPTLTDVKMSPIGDLVFNALSIQDKNHSSK